MAEKIIPKVKQTPVIGIRKIDPITYELYSYSHPSGEITSILKETFWIVEERARGILQQMAEGTYHG